MEYTFKNLDAYDAITDAVLLRYNQLLTQLKGEEVTVLKEELQEVKDRKASELLLFMLDTSENIAGMAHVSYQFVPTHPSGYINTVVVDEAYRGGGLGTHLMNELERRAKERWTGLQGFALTSAPKRGTQGFYVRLGYRMRTKEAGDETTVYVKDVE